MRVPAFIYGDDKIINELRADYTRDWSATRQMINVASLPGIQKGMLAMSDVHPGYGFPIGGVVAFDDPFDKVRDLELVKDFSLRSIRWNNFVELVHTSLR